MTTAGQEKTNTNEEHKPCKICEKLNKGTRYHPETLCWFKSKQNTATYVANSVIEAEVIETEQKNE